MTSTDQAIAEYLARGGRITKLPPCCSSLSGSVDRETLGPSPAQMTWRERQSRMDGAEIEAHRKKMAEAAERKERNREEDSRLMRDVAERRSADRLRRILLHIDGQWTSERIASAAKMDRSSTKQLRAYLRAKGYGNSFPDRRIPEKAPTVAPAMKADRRRKDTTGRDNGIRADKAAGLPIREICLKWGVKSSTVYEVAKGIKDPRFANKRSAATPVKARPHLTPEQDRAIAAHYLARNGIRACARKFGVSMDGAMMALTRCGVQIRATGKRGPQAVSELDRQVADHYLAGNGRNDTAVHFGKSRMYVTRALVRCGVPIRTKAEQEAMNAQRGAA